ncbi:hypothetical protein [Olivibacter sitiensis]|uniref:hypothetical protein n=1 Tax=Olivibacter sitiensis TaxID=376470 RepID=UPI0004800CDD|nr:hypothetical protein [Olivibacter sitiensis]
MEMQILVVGITCFSMDDLKQIKGLLRDEYGLKRLPSNDTYLLCYVPEGLEDDILSDLDDRHFSNPAYEIIRRDINSQAELEALSYQLLLEER